MGVAETGEMGKVGFKHAQEQHLESDLFGCPNFSQMGLMQMRFAATTVGCSRLAIRCST